jgi:hypothetical protein
VLTTNPLEVWQTNQGAERRQSSIGDEPSQLVIDTSVWFVQERPGCESASSESEE